MGALETAARSISVDFAKVGLHVRANVVTPGFVMTPLANSMPTPLVSALSQATLLPPGQTTTPDMVAQTYCTSDFPPAYDDLPTHGAFPCC